MLGAFGVLRLSNSPAIGSRNILVNLGEWGLMPVHGAAVVGKKFGIFLFKLLPRERIGWLPAAFFSAVCFKKMPFF